MIFIPVIHKLSKLFTLKHSCFLAIFTLKRSWIYAETLLHSIYTYIYLYKRTCSWQPQIVDNYFLKSFLPCLVLLSTTIVLTACCKVNPDENIQNAVLHLTKPPYKHFQQWEGDQFHPRAYFTCGNFYNSCRQYSVINNKKMKKINSSNFKKESR